MPHPEALSRHLTGAVQASGPGLRADALAAAWSALARRHNTAGLTSHVDASMRNYYGRPAQVLLADRFRRCLPGREGDTLSLAAGSLPAGVYDGDAG